MAGAAISRCIERYIRRRTPSAAPPLRVSRRRVYILPTASGGLFALLLVVMGLGATHYQNNLAFALTFWLGATALVSMHRAHRNLVGLSLTTASAPAAFAGQTLDFRITLASNARIARHSLRICGMPESKSGTAPAAPRLTVPATAPRTIPVSVAAGRRGYRRCPMLRIESRYPLGLFRAWTQLAPATWALVYPYPHGDSAYPAAAGHEPGQTADGARGGEQFIGHRRYRAGDSPRRIDWKASARGTELLVTEHSDAQRPTRWFDYDRLTGLSAEARLSQLALWVINAETDGQPYALVLSGQCLGPALGSAHRHACLAALATH